uniref:Uncharacterized protein n=1 Tax=Panagrellus redivivus TaxID=6233 RepID=A0A7E4V9I0_PANRE
MGFDFDTKYVRVCHEIKANLITCRGEGLPQDQEVAKHSLPITSPHTLHPIKNNNPCQFSWSSAITASSKKPGKRHPRDRRDPCSLKKSHTCAHIPIPATRTFAALLRPSSNSPFFVGLREAKPRRASEPPAERAERYRRRAPYKSPGAARLQSSVEVVPIRFASRQRAVAVSAVAVRRCANVERTFRRPKTCVSERSLPPAHLTRWWSTQQHVKMSID